jgi:hypothetical protein
MVVVKNWCKSICIGFMQILHIGNAEMSQTSKLQRFSGCMLGAHALISTEDNLLSIVWIESPLRQCLGVSG